MNKMLKIVRETIINFKKKICGAGILKTLIAAKLDKFLSKKAPSVSLPNSEDSRNMIRVFDAYGRELFITRQQWRDNVLLANIEERWDDADKLSEIITQALHDQFFEEIIKPAERLLQLEEVERSVVLLAIVYLKTGRLDDSEQVLRHYISRNGESGVVLTNLAKVLSERGNQEEMIAMLWHALELDPNQENGLAWYEAICREKGGDQEGLRSLRRIAALPGSWRVQLWLARKDLEAQRFEQAMTLYHESLTHAGEFVPTDLLMQMSSDLGNAACLNELLQLVEPAFDPRVHGLPVGHNLIKANLDLGRLEKARTILNQLYGLTRPDWRENLDHWDAEITKAELSRIGPVSENDLKVELMVSVGPVWLKPDTPIANLLVVKHNNSPVISFIGSTVEPPNLPDHIQQQLTDPSGRMSRALPAFLAEQIEFFTTARAQIIVPWVVEPQCGFFLGVMPWSEIEVIKILQQCSLKSDFVVLTHLLATTDQWSLQLRLIRTTDMKNLGQLEEIFPMATPAAALRQLVIQLLGLLVAKLDIVQQSCPPNYVLPAGDQLMGYLLRLEQMLAVSCNSTGNKKYRGLNGEREIIDGNLWQCLDIPLSVNARLLFAKTLLSMKSIRPDILSEVAERVALLQTEKPLSEPFHGLVQQLFDEAFAT